MSTLGSTTGAALEVGGLVGAVRTYDFAALAALPGQIADVSELAEGREGAAVRLTSVIERSQPDAGAAFITLFAEGDYSASVPLAAVIDQAILIYRLGDGPLPAARGGPVRFLIPDVAACQTAEVDSCANVKFLQRIELGSERGPDSRPRTRASHAELHRA